MPIQCSIKLDEISLEIDAKLDAIETVYIALNTLDSDQLNPAISSTLLNSLNDLTGLNKQLKTIVGESIDKSEFFKQLMANREKTKK